MDGPILVLQDTTEFTFKRSAPERIGFTKVSTGRKKKGGRLRQHTLCGLLMHASLAVTPEGLPLGLTAVKFWSRDKFSKRCFRSTWRAVGRPSRIAIL